eukprot:Sdes_comp11058_c0_seq1m2682
MKNYVDIEERRLRPIYDAIDGGNNKLALQLIEKLLKKQNDSKMAKCLKALVLSRCGRTAEAIEVIDEVEKARPTDELVLQTLNIALKDMTEYERIVRFYQNSIADQPNPSEDLVSQLFLAHVRNYDFKNQQQVSMGLYRKY